jgi:hypothetical protein
MVQILTVTDHVDTLYLRIYSTIYLALTALCSGIEREKGEQRRTHELKERERERQRERLLLIWCGGKYKLILFDLFPFLAIPVCVQICKSSHKPWTSDERTNHAAFFVGRCDGDIFIKNVHFSI